MNGSDSGTDYVVFGASTATAVTALASLTGSNGFAIKAGAANDHTGLSVAAAGDVNGDGRGDILMGADGADQNSRGNSGSSYVLLGGLDTSSTATVDIDGLSRGQGQPYLRFDGATAGQIVVTRWRAPATSTATACRICIGAPYAGGTSAGATTVIYRAEHGANFTATCSVPPCSMASNSTVSRLLTAAA